MNIALVLNLIGFVLTFSSLFMLLPVAASFIYHGDDMNALVSSFLISFSFGLFLYYITKKQKKVELKHRDGFAVVTLSWIAMSLFGALPYILSDLPISFTDAYFESMAGFTTTGSSMLSSLESLPKGILLWRSLTQWIGGMGIIVLSIAILPMLGVGGMQLFKAEVPDIGLSKIKPRIIDTAKSLWYIYAGLTYVLAALLLLGGMDIFDAVCHAFTTMATGGFSTKSASIAHFNSVYIDVVITVFMFLAGVNFSLHFYALRGDFTRLHKSTEFRMYCSIILIATAIVTVYNMKYMSFDALESLRYASFQVVSIITTTGYATADYEIWPFLPQMLLICLMFFGGMVGSTGGGIKQVRVLLMFKQAYRELYHLIHPHAVTVLKLDGKSLPKETIGGIWGFLFLFIFISIFSSICLTFMGVDLVTAVSTVISSMSNVGPALGDAGPTENYASIPAAGKWVLIMCMLIGRLEIYTVIVLLIPRFWQK